MVKGMFTASATRDGQVGRGLPPVGSGRDVEEHQFVGPFVAITPGQLDRIARVAEALEVRPLHDPPVRHVQAGDDADGQAGPAPWGMASSLRE